MLNTQTHCFPLSFAQQQLWFLEQLAVNGAGYTIPNAYRIQGHLQIDALSRSMVALIQRHQALRTIFQELDGQPVQIVTENLEFQLAQSDLRSLPGSAKAVEARKIAEAVASQPFDLTQYPLWRTTLIQLEEDEYWLIFTIHHIIFDGWSSEIFLAELISLYEADCQGRSPNLPAVPQPYQTFVQWQQQHLQGQRLEDLLAYWRQTLGSGVHPLELPTDFPRPPQQSYRGAILTMPLPASLGKQLQILSQQRQVTLFMTMLAAFKVLLFRYTGQADITVGTPIANRSRPEQEGMIGFLVNTLVLRTPLEGKQSFWDLLPQVRTVALGAFDHADLPFELLVETLRPERDLSYNPLFQVMFQLQNETMVAPASTMLTVSPLTIDTCTANFDLTLDIGVTATGLEATVEYATDLFKPDTIQRLLGHYQTLLEGIVAAPRQPIAQLPLLTPAEQHQLMRDWNPQSGSTPSSRQSGVGDWPPLPADFNLCLQATAAGIVGQITHNSNLTNNAIATVLEQYLAQLRQGVTAPDHGRPCHFSLVETPGETPGAASQIVWADDLTSTELPDSGIQCLHRYFEAQVRRTPDQIALCDQTQQLSYGQLNIRANQVAHQLMAWGVKPDIPVGLCFERSVEMVVALLAVLKAGGAYLPLDPDYPSDRLQYMLEDAQVGVVLTQAGLRSRLPLTTQQVLCLDQAQAQLDQAGADDPESGVTSDHLAYIIYTSGSTGKPKGVMIEHRAASHFVQAAIRQYAITGADCMLQFGSISFDLAVEEIFTTLATGARLQLRNDDMLGSPSRFLRTCQDWGITVLDLPTAYWHQLVAAMVDQPVRVPPSVRLVIIGGERALPSRVKTWQQQVGAFPRLINSYGPTEATVVATGFWITPDADIPQEVPIGKPFPHTETYILDEFDQPVPVGIPGELYIGGHSLARGYLNRPDQTRQQFVPHPFNPQPNARLYKTGDRVRYLPDGNIEYLGRIDNQVKLRGFRIEIGEIEAALLQYPGVRETAVLVREDDPGQLQLVAYVVEYPQQPVSMPALRSFLQQRLPNYMVPAALVPLAALPLTPNGKVDRRALPLPAQVAPSPATPVTTPRTPLEATLVTLWSEILQQPQIGIDDSFFELGGHSLQAVQLIARIIQDLQVELPLSALFRAPTVAAMAQLLSEAGAEAPWSPLVSLQPGGSKPPFFAVHGGHGEVLFYQSLATQLGPDQPFYALRGRGNDFPDLPHRQVEAMASCYIDAIREVQPEGPYRLGGASLGGIVAFEMAQQLLAQGQQTERLVIFDTGGFDDYIQPLPLHQRIINGFRFIPRYGLAETGKRIHLRLLKWFTNESAAEFYRATGTLPNQLSREIAIWEIVWRANLDAMAQYQPRPYPGKITLLRAVDDGDYMWNHLDPGYGWDRYAGLGVDSYDLPGTHIGMFQPPHVEQLARILQRLLESPQSP